MNEQLQSTLFVGIDVSSKSNYVYAMDFFAKKLLSFSCQNNFPGASVLITNLCNCLKTENLKYVVIAMESTSYYSFHICNYLSSSPDLACFKPKVFCLNPKVIKAYRESFVSLDKTDPLDSMVISDFARTGKITSLPFQGSCFVALQRLTRQRLHIVENLNREKTFALSNIFLKFSELAVLDKTEQPFSDRFGASFNCISSLEKQIKELDKAIFQFFSLLSYYIFLFFANLLFTHFFVIINL